MKKKILIWSFIILLIIVVGAIVLININKDNEDGFTAIKSESDLRSYYNSLDNNKSIQNIPKYLLTLPVSMFSINRYNYYPKMEMIYNGISVDAALPQTANGTSSSKDYSTTNVQVENVDEADVTKTDGSYIYSISDNNVVITDVRDESNIKVVAKYEMDYDAIPQDLMLYKNRLVVIGSAQSNKISSYSYFYYYYNNSTVVNILDLSNIEKPKLEKTYRLDQNYYTSRCIDGNLYIISSGRVNTKIDDDDNVAIPYSEDYANKEVEYSNIKYMKSNKTEDLTLIAYTDLNDSKLDVGVSSYFMDINEAYISQNNIYLAMHKYSNDVPKVTIKALFTLKGIPGFISTLYNYDYSSTYNTEIYKFAIDKHNVEYQAKTKTEGRIINQFSFDEYNNMLRVALYDNSGSRIVVFDSKLKEIGRTENLAEGERMYSSRFIGNKAYLVTYKTVDPLFVIDLSNPTAPKMIGYLKIPGYSTYLHPYDDNHIIGIGMQTETKVYRDDFGRVVSNNTVITGMKMALFDVTDVSNPKEISSVVIGDSRTTSSILTNHKALLFSKEKNILAIPINNYSKDFEVTYTTDNISSIISSYENKKDYISEGYIVYDITLENGIKQKGIINHDTDTAAKSDWYYNYNTSLLRGLYINDNLYTVSESTLKVNKLSDLTLIKELKLK